MELDNFGLSFVPNSYLRVEHVVPKLKISDHFVPSSHLRMEDIQGSLTGHAGTN